MEGLQGQGERFDDKKSTSNVQRSLSLQKTDTPLKARRQILDSSSLIQSQTDSSNNISYNCCCQCLKPAGVPSLPIFCPCILQ